MQHIGERRSEQGVLASGDGIHQNSLMQTVDDMRWSKNHTNISTFARLFIHWRHAPASKQGGTSNDPQNALMW
jgi:hypothetical protein